jgi:hypothetical protein
LAGYHHQITIKMEKATLKNLLTIEEITKYLPSDYTINDFIENHSLSNLLKIGTAILPLIYPNTITDGSSIIGKTFEFLAKRAAEKGFTIF